MKIILLSGKPNSGKTTALNLLYEKITGKKYDGSNPDAKYKNKVSVKSNRSTFYIPGE
jgi:tRNA uridine 5-carbamoylmethylation protein Kti12